jgi:hypothetical protein
LTDLHDLDSLLDLSAPVLFFPVRHHSPTAARLVGQLIRQRRPGAVLVEGPADFNDRMDELLLPHRLPIAIYSFIRRPDGPGRAAYYPLCEHSPEWQALRIGEEVGAILRFIDVPWGEMRGTEEEPSNRYTDNDFRRSDYVRTLCQRVGVDDFHTLWDTLFEVEADLSIKEYLRRCHSLCGNMRLLEHPGRHTDRVREAYMAQMIEQARQEGACPIVVVTGGYHSVALQARLSGSSSPLTEPERFESAPMQEGEERGIALTPYSFERLDSLAGYEAGMPNPGFYQQLWHDRRQGQTSTYQTLLERITNRLRDKNQIVSAADLIAAETTARGLAALRGHTIVWRSDLVDGLKAALIKDELALGGHHPLLDAIHEVLRGGERGQLAEGARLPPLVQNIQGQLRAHDLQAQTTPRELELQLEGKADRGRSQVLHRLRLLDIAGFERIAGTDWSDREELARVWENWRITWSPDFDARCIEAARYGSNLSEAAGMRLEEIAREVDRDAGAVARVLLDSALAGLTHLASTLFQRLEELIRTDSDFLRITEALGYLLYLYRYDTVLETAGRGDLGRLLHETFTRGLWLLETLGQVSGQEEAMLEGVQILRETLERCADLLDLDRQEVVEVLARVGADAHQGASVRGAATGALWSLGEANSEQVRKQLLAFASPEHLGDFLTGLFALAREQVQRQRELVLSIHDLLAGYSDEAFLTALPALRLAFTYFTPREKHYLALTLREALGLIQVPEMAALTVTVESAARALAFEGKLFETLKKYGIRGGEE